MTPIAVRSSRLQVLATVFLVVSVLLCAMFMPAMAMAALGGCVAVVGLMVLARRERAIPRAPRPWLFERSTPKPVTGAGPPARIPLRT